MSLTLGLFTEGRSPWMQNFQEPLAVAPGFPASQAYSEHCPWRQDGKVVRGTGFGIGQIWTQPSSSSV